MKRKTYLQIRAGSLKNLVLKEENLNDPAENEVTVDLKAIGLNFADIFAIKGLYSATPKGPFIPGLEYSGVVAEIGKNVKNFVPGDKIMGVTRFGAYATKLNIDNRYLTKLPDNWSFNEGASFIVQAVTAYYALAVLGAIKNNQVVLIHSAAGGVGIWANRIAKKFAAYTIGTVGDITKSEKVKDETYDAIVERNSEYDRKLDEILPGRKPDIILDPVGGKYFKSGYKILNQGGRLITYGSANFNTGKTRPDYLKVLIKYLTRPKLDPMQMINHNKSVMGFNLIYLWEKTDDLQDYIKKLLELNLGKPVIDSIYNFDQLKKALYYYQNGKSVGKIVVEI